MWGKIALVAKTWYNLCKICSQAGLYQIPPKIQEWKLVIKDKFRAKSAERIENLRHPMELQIK